MDAVDALALLEALLIIAALLAHTAIRLISPSLHASNHVALDSSDSDSALVSWAPSSDDSANTKYDVFLSFRGEDTRDNFTSHLYEALCRAKIQTFIDDKIPKGEGVNPVLHTTIENSDIYVIVFSKDYASSTWCLEELLKILECKNKYKREVIPIFYQVDPTHVRKQSGSYGDAFIKHNHRFMNNKVQMWRHALTQAANLSGWDSNNIRPESKLVKEIVKVVLSKLKGMSLSHFEGLVGINDRVKKIKTILSDLHIVGIWGMGGIGKTTLAKAVFHELKAQFDSYSFVNVSEELDRIGLAQLHKKCLQELLEGDDVDTYSIGSNLVKKRLQSKKILLVLDNVDDSIQVEDLVKLLDWFGQGSRIIITSRDRQVLKNFRAYEPYCVQGMNSHDAFRLFSLKAFNQNEPSQNYLELSKSVLSYCQGIPLALIVLGCFLHGRKKEEWESALENLKQAPHDVIFNVLKLSFDTLDDKQKSIFLDIACFFRRKMTLHEANIQSYYDFSTEIVLSVLKDRSLISVDEYGSIVMHDLIVAMGQEVAHRQFINEPEKPIRLCRHEDIYHVLRNNVAIEKIQGISLDVCEIKKIDLKVDVFRKMYNLRILQFYKSHLNLRKLSKVNILEDFNFLPEELRILHWEDYPMPTVPLSFCVDNLVRLQMLNSSLQKLWDEDQHFPNLKVINLSDSMLLTQLPDLSQAPNIEELWLGGCVNLLHINSSKSLVKLNTLCLDRCKKLKSAEILTFCNHLSLLSWEQSPLEQLWNNGQQEIEESRGISVDMCERKKIHLIDDGFKTTYNLRIRKFYKSHPRNPSKANILDNFNFLSEELKILDWEDYPLSNVPLSFCADNLVRLQMLNSNLQKLWDEDQHFPNLKVINISGSKFLTELPDLSQAPNITEIWVGGCVNLLQINSSKSLVKLKTLCFDRCKKLRNAEILTFCNQLSHLYWEQCPFKSLPLSCLRNLKHLEMPESKLEQLWDGKQHFPKLLQITLAKSKYLTRMPDLSQAPNVVEINLERCTSLLQLYSSSSLSNLNALLLTDCSKLRVEKLWDRNQHFPKLYRIDVRGCNYLIELPDLSRTPNIQDIMIDDCVNLLQLHCSSALLKLNRLNFSCCKKLRLVNLAGNVYSRSSGALKIACNYFDHKNLTFNKMCIKFFLSDDGNIYAFGFKAAAVAFTKMWDCMHVTESGELKLLARTLSSSLPFVRKLRWIDITSSIDFDSSMNHYMLEIFHYNFKRTVTDIQLMKKRLEFELEKSKGKECMRRTRNKGGSVLEKGMTPQNSIKLYHDCICDTIEGTTTEGARTELEEVPIRKVECCSNTRLTRSPNSITHWSFLTDLSLQKTNIMNVRWSIPGLLFLKALAKSDCSRLQTILDLTFPVKAERSRLYITFSENLNRRDLYRIRISNNVYYMNKNQEEGPNFRFWMRTLWAQADDGPGE